jgi:hypothetical protein
MMFGAGRTRAYSVLALTCLACGGLTLSILREAGGVPLREGEPVPNAPAPDLSAPPSETAPATLVPAITPAKSGTVENLIEVSRVLGEIQETISRKSTELHKLETLIAEREGQLDALEAALVQKGLELDRIVQAVREQDYAVLASLDWTLGDVGDLPDDASGSEDTKAISSPGAQSNIGKIRSIVYEARLKARNAAASTVCEDSSVELPPAEGPIGAVPLH